MMDNKQTRYVVKIFTLDRIEQSTGIFTWNKDDIGDFLEEEAKHYGLKIISDTEEVLMIMEYANIIWNYKIYYGSYKKRYKSFIENDIRWAKIENEIEQDLKIMELDNLKKEIMKHLKNSQYYEYQGATDKLCKKYCIKEKETD